ncbi:MAG: carboxypeptidase regulatory-like domain-containing protein, partial [Flavobacteriales bacterium]|nr:carboxypeptidase regulatory-like domain-containing protein [Flavobacteriales bacterium]
MKRFLSVYLAFMLANLAFTQVKLNGNVRDADGAPLPFASVQLGDFGMLAQTDTQGTFKARGLFEGDLRLRISSVGFLPKDTVIALQAGENSIKLVMQRSTVQLSAAEVTALRAGDRAPFAKSTLSAPDIAKTNAGVDLPYLLDMQPSVVVGSDGGTGIGYTNMRIRGS